MFSAFALLAWWLLLRGVAGAEPWRVGRVRRERRGDAAHAPVRAARRRHPGGLGRRRAWRSRSSPRRHERRTGASRTGRRGPGADAGPRRRPRARVPRRGAGRGGARALVPVRRAPWIPGPARTASGTRSTPGAIDVRLEPDLFKRVAEWLLGNTARRHAARRVLLVLAMLLAPFLTQGPRSRRRARRRWARSGFFLCWCRSRGRWARTSRSGGSSRWCRSGCCSPRSASSGRSTACASSGCAAAAVVVVGVAVAVIVLLGWPRRPRTTTREKTNYREFARVVRDAPEGRAGRRRPGRPAGDPVDQGVPRLEGRAPPVRFIAAGDPPPTCPCRRAGSSGSPASPPNVPELATAAERRRERCR